MAFTAVAGTGWGWGAPEPAPAAKAPADSAVGAAAGAPLAARFADTGNFTFTVSDQTWRDAVRNRDVPVRIFLPKRDERAGGASGERYPVVVFSHGAGGSREGYAYAATHLASHGYLVVLPQHAGSDTAAWRSAAGGPVAKMVDDAANLENRPRDVSFVLDQVSHDPELAARADMNRVGGAGHSFGAYTSLAAAGLRVKIEGATRSWPDARVKAAVAMSPQGTGTMGIHAASWDAITVPVLCLTGTKDMGQGQRAAAWRRDILGHIKAPTTFIEIVDANHMTFAISKGGLSDSQRARGGSYNEEHNRLIRLSLTAFLDAYVRGDQAARAYVEGEGLKAAVEVGASFERAGQRR